MNDWVNIKNLDQLMHGFQTSATHGGWTEGLSHHLKKLQEQNDQIISLLRQLINKSYLHISINTDRKLKIET